MVNGIVNLTRKVLPKISSIPAKNIESVNAMPEMVLSRMRREGAKNIAYCDMNQSVAAIISPNGINTVYADSLAGCNAANIIARLKDGRLLSIMSHYVPTNVDGQIKSLETQLTTYAPHIDTSRGAQAFLNIRGRDSYAGLEPVSNPIIEKLKGVLMRFFPKGSKIDITPYLNTNRPAFFSSANIFQFNPSNTSQVKITNVGENERLVDLVI